MTEPGSKLGKYTIVEQLGEGSMGTVFKAYDEALDRHVAIKTMTQEIQWNSDLKQRFLREARAAASLHHPNIITIHDLGEEGKVTYIVMELLLGKGLKALIREGALLTLETKLSVMMQVADGLNHAHGRGIIHRDIKPGNIHLEPGDIVKILDFGIARIPASQLTRSGARLGTPLYMSPEQIRGEPTDERSDIFSTGIVFYALVTSIHPFRDKTTSASLENILYQRELRLDEHMPGAPGGLRPILETCLAKDPDHRYGSMAELGRACRNLRQELIAAAARLTSEVESLLPQLKQNGSFGRIVDDGDALVRGREQPDYLALQRWLASARAALAAESDLDRTRRTTTLDRAEASTARIDRPSTVGAQRESMGGRPERERIYRFRVEHPHGGSSAACSGELLISGVDVAYWAGDPGHAFHAPFESLRLEQQDDCIEIIGAGKERRTLRARDATQAASIRQLWEKLEKIVTSRQA
jgi:serine/threonine protein kinase